MEYVFRSTDRCNLCDSPRRTIIGRRLNQSQGIRPTRLAGVSVGVARCDDCGLIYPDPLPLPKDLGQHYDTPAESYWKPEYFDPEPEYFRGQIDTFYRLWKGEHPAALDIGAGIGKCIRALQARGFDAHGLEPSPAFRQAAVDGGGIDADRIQVAAVEDATYPDRHFDLVTFGAVLEHLPDPAGSIERALRWTRPGGLMHIEVPSTKWLTSRIVNRAYRLQGLDYVTNLSPMHPPYHLYEFTLASFERHAERAGYTVAFAQQMPGHDTFLPGPDRMWRALMAKTGTGMQLQVWLRAA